MKSVHIGRQLLIILFIRFKPMRRCTFQVFLHTMQIAPSLRTVATLHTAVLLRSQHTLGRAQPLLLWLKILRVSQPGCWTCRMAGLVDSACLSNRSIHQAWELHLGHTIVTQKAGKTCDLRHIMNTSALKKVADWLLPLPGVVHRRGPPTRSL